MCPGVTLRHMCFRVNLSHMCLGVTLRHCERHRDTFSGQLPCRNVSGANKATAGMHCLLKYFCGTKDGSGLVSFSKICC
jgi:hypothetical protein